MNRMTTSVVTGGAGFLGSHLCDYLLEHDHRVICVDNLETGSLENIEHLQDADFQFVHQDVVQGIWIDEHVDFVFHLASPASPIDYLRLPLQTLKVGSVGTQNALGLAKWKRARFLISSTSEVYGDPQVHPQPETLLGARQPDRPARRLRRGQALRRGADDGVPQPAGREYRDRSYLQYVRPEDAKERRPRDGHVPAPGTRGQAAHRLRRRLADAVALLRRRPDPRPLPARHVRRAPAGQHRQPRSRGDDARARRRRASRSPGSTSEIVFEALPVDDPKERRPDITKARQILGWEPEVDLEEGLRRWVQALGYETGSRLMSRRAARARRRGAHGAARRVGAARDSVALPAGRAVRRVPAPLWPTTDTVAELTKLHVQVARLTLYWGGPLGVAKRRPAHPGNPSDPAYDWSAYDTIVKQLHAAGIQPLLGILGTPPWENKAKGLNVVPASVSDLRAFAYAASLRYSGTYVSGGETLPAVHDWLAWNEPNNPVFLKPQ